MRQKKLLDDYGDKFNQRKVLTIKRENGKFTGQLFEFDNLTATQKAKIKGSGFPTTFNSFSTDDEKFKELINYLKGDKKQEDANKFHSRQAVFEDGTQGRNILGAIMRSSPIVSGIPRVSDLHPDRQSEDYINFVTRYLYKEDGTSSCESPCTNAVAKDNVDIIYVGANDGMLHAFRAKDGKEVFSYLPDAVYKNLTKLTEDRKHVSFVDGNIGIVVINNGKKWTKFLSGSMGGGAKGIYALDITDPTASGVKPADIVQWEFTDEDSDNVGNIIAKPATVQLNDGTWVTVIGNGYNSKNNKAALIMINAETGELIQEIVLDNQYTDDKVPNGLAAAFFQIFPQKEGIKSNGVDRAYAGDLQGNLWVFDFTGATKKGGVKVVSKANEEKPLFIATDSAGVKQPITVAPLVRQHPTKYGNIVHFGTGALFEENDLSSGITNSIYAIWDDWMENSVKKGGGLPVPRIGILVERAHLRQLAFDEPNGETLKTVSGVGVVGRTLKQGAGYNQPIEWATQGSNFSIKKRGWYVDLPKGERAWQSPYYTFGANNVEAIGYDTANYSPVNAGSAGGTAVGCDSSSSGVISWKMAFDINDGTNTLPSHGTIDTDRDGNVTEDDEVTKKGRGTTPLAGLLSSGINFSDKAMSTFSPLEEVNTNSSDPSSKNRICNFVTQAAENNNKKNNFLSKQICRKSHAGTWLELR